ncbi:MAG: DUF1800 family protein [Rhodothermales bacterium]
MLTPLESPLTRTQAAHLLRRACFSSDEARIRAMTGRTAADVVDEWLAEPVMTALIPNPYWLQRQYPPVGAPDDDVRAFLRDNEYYAEEIRQKWVRDLLSGTLRSRMTVLWHNHFVTDIRKYRYGALAHQYLLLLTLSSLGNFKALVRSMAKDGSMLYYLDGRFNRSGAPNENYARELLELFTMGPLGADGSPNYTQADIVDAARAFTGWVMDVRTTWTSRKQTNRFDAGQKTFLGQTGNFDQDNIADLIFEHRPEAVAWFLAQTFIREFIYDEPETDTAQSLAAEWLAADFQIKPVLRALLTSTAFFDERFVGARIKSPLEFLTMGISWRAGTVADEKLESLVSAVDSLGQTLLSPPNVAGWPGHHQWLSTESLPSRWNADARLADMDTVDMNWADLIPAYLEPGSTHPAVSFALNLAESMFAVPLEHVSIPEIDTPFAGDLVNSPLPDDLLNGPAWRMNLVKLFLGPTPWYEWSPEGPFAWAFVRNYFVALSQFPEYQLS